MQFLPSPSHAGTNALDQSVPELQNVARYWVGYLRKAAFRLRAKLGVDVEVRLSRKERKDSELQAQNSTTRLCRKSFRLCRKHLASMPKSLSSIRQMLPMKVRLQRNLR